MADWSIAKQIGALSGLLASALVVIMLMGVGSTLSLNNTFDGYSTLSRETLTVGNIQEEVLKARVSELHFRYDRKSIDVDEVISSLDETASQLAVFAEEAGTDNPAFRSLSSALEGLGVYRAKFLETVEASETQERAKDIVVETGLAARVAMTEILNDAAATGDAQSVLLAGLVQQELILSRLYVDRFLRTADEESFQEFTGHKAEARRLITQLSSRISMSGTDFSPVLDRFNQFDETAKAMRETQLALIRNFNELDEIGESVLARVEAVFGDLLEKRTALSDDSSDKMALTLVLLSVVSIATVIVSLLLARVLSRRVKTAISASVAQLNEIAKGNLDTEITGAHRSNEFGQIARALEVFRDTARESRRLAAEQATAERERIALEEEQARAARAAEKARMEEIARERQAMIAELQQSIGAVVEKAARGDFTGRITSSFKEAKLNDLAADVNALVQSVESGLEEMARVLSSMSEGDLTAKMTGKFDGIFAKLQNDVNATVQNLSNIVREIGQQSDSLLSEAQGMSSKAEELARRAEQQAASLEETSAAMEEIAASAKSASASAASANEIAEGASGRVDDAGRVVANAVEAMGDIRTASSRIGEIVSVIEGIAFQTNLLALNASVEAARAGAAGKGFAVVATEVRALAQRSSAASQDIKTLIDESASQVARGVELVEATGKTLEEIVEGVRSMADSMRGLVTTGKEQAIGVQEVTLAISQLDTITQKNAALADESRGTAGQLRAGAEAMRRLLSGFRTDAGAAASVAAAHAPRRPGIAA